MSSDERHPADFLAQLASAIKAVRDRGGKWNRTADTIQWASERIERLEAENERFREMYANEGRKSMVLAEELSAARSKLEEAEKAATVYGDIIIKRDAEIETLTSRLDQLSEANLQRSFVTDKKIAALESRLGAAVKLLDEWEEAIERGAAVTPLEASYKLRAALAGSVVERGSIIDVREPPYNAKGDGVTDDTAAVQKAVNVAAFRSLLDQWMRDDPDEQARTMKAIEDAGLLRF